MDKSGLRNLTRIFNSGFLIHHIVFLLNLKTDKISFKKYVVTVTNRYRISTVTISFVTLFSLSLVFGSIFQQGVYARGQNWSQADDDVEKICNSPAFASFCKKSPSTIQPDPFDTITHEEQKENKIG